MPPHGLSVSSTVSPGKNKITIEMYFRDGLNKPVPYCKLRLKDHVSYIGKMVKQKVWEVLDRVGLSRTTKQTLTF